LTISVEVVLLQRQNEIINTDIFSVVIRTKSSAYVNPFVSTLEVMPLLKCGDNALLVAALLGIQPIAFGLYKQKLRHQVQFWL
jgi:hypothetical protein